MGNLKTFLLQPILRGLLHWPPSSHFKGWGKILSTRWARGGWRGKVPAFSTLQPVSLVPSDWSHLPVVVDKTGADSSLSNLLRACISPPPPALCENEDHTSKLYKFYENFKSFLKYWSNEHLHKAMMVVVGEGRGILSSHSQTNAINDVSSITLHRQSVLSAR